MRIYEMLKNRLVFMDGGKGRFISSAYVLRGIIRDPTEWKSRGPFWMDARFRIYCGKREPGCADSAPPRARRSIERICEAERCAAKIASLKSNARVTEADGEEATGG